MRGAPVGRDGDGCVGDGVEEAHPRRGHVARLLADGLEDREQDRHDFLS